MPHTEERTFCWRLTNESSFSTYMGVFFIHSVSGTTFAILFLPKLPADHLINAVDHILRNTAQIYECGEPWWNDIDGGNWRAQRKTCPSATSPITNPTWTDLSTNPGCCGERLTLLTTWAIVGLSVKVKNAWNYTSTHRTSSWFWFLIRYTDSTNFNLYTIYYVFGEVGFKYASLFCLKMTFTFDGF
jgi:hypothetical protein